MKKVMGSLKLRIAYFASAFVVAVSSLTVLAPFMYSQTANAVSLETVYSQDFSSNVGDWIDGTNGWYGSVTHEGGYGVAKMTSPTETGPFSRLGGYVGLWKGNYTVSTDVYLNSAWADGVGFEYSVASNGSDGNHQRDFVFHVAKNPTTHELWVAADNNASIIGGNYAVQTDLSGYANKYQITGGGDWYTMKYTFRDNGGQLAVDMQLIRRSSGQVLFTETRTNPADTIPAEVGGHRYAWFTAINNPIGIKFDNVKVVQEDYTPTGLNIKRDAGSVNVTGSIVKDTAHNLWWDASLVAGSLYQVQVTDPDGIVKTWRTGSTNRFDLDRGSAFAGEFGQKQGTYSYQVRLQQAAAPYAGITDWSDPVTLTYDSVKPVIDNVTIDRALTNDTTITVNGTVTDDNLKDYNIRVYKEDKSSQVTPWTGYTGTSEVVDGELATLNISTLADGNYWVRVWANDLAGNQTGISSHIYVPFTIDRTAPSLTVNNYVGTDVTPLITGTTDVDPSVVISLVIDGGTPVLATNNGNGTWSYLVPSDLSIGTHTVVATATDLAENATVVNSSVQIVAEQLVLFNTSTQAGGGNTAAGAPAPVTVAVNGNQAVLGDQTDAADAANNNAVDGEAEVQSATDTQSSAAGLAWYWWILIAAILAAIAWWFFAAYRRRQNQE